MLLAVPPVVALLEIVVIILVGRAIGPWWTVGLLVAFSVLGAVLVRREGRKTWSALRSAVNTGRMPAREAADAALVLAGGLLLMVPGFLTGVIGLVLVLPFSRGISRRLLSAVIGTRLLGGVLPGEVRGGGAVRGPQRSSEVIEGEVLHEDPPPPGSGSGPPA